MKRRTGIVLVLALVAGLLAWAAFAPLQASSRDRLFEIPKGTWERRMKGDKTSILPERITLTLGVRDVLRCATATRCRKSSVRS